MTEEHSCYFQAILQSSPQVASVLTADRHHKTGKTTRARYAHLCGNDGLIKKA